MRLRLTLVVLGLATPGLAQTPIAEMICGAHDEIVTRLTKGQRATLVGMGVRGPDAVMEIWQAADGDWTLVQSYANGQSCILAMGSDWADLGVPAEG
ncbi:hypothetical protein [Tabrizicola sp.]|uniref:hypothetical protein n=1 Tax=Tabrizicola sp. TaxID=2005166 RepID=UPI00286B177B|nr:hypothetical protein [Tabrizicola sp.]